MYSKELNPQQMAITYFNLEEYADGQCLRQRTGPRAGLIKPHIFMIVWAWRA